MKRIYPQNHKPVDFLFKQSRDDFQVDEIPLVPFKGKGNFTVIRVRKVNLSTWDLIEILSNVADIHQHRIGYAGLKDKNATTVQYLSFPSKMEGNLRRLRHKNITILETTRHDQPVKMGMLRGNRFRITVKRVHPKDAAFLGDLLKTLETEGVPNYFGYQRFGREGENFEEAKEVVYGDRFVKDPKLRKMLASAYQSHFFNRWLAFRTELARNTRKGKWKEAAALLHLPENEAAFLKDSPLFPLLPGDLMSTFPEGNSRKPMPWEEMVAGMQAKTLVPSGLLPGRRAYRASELAGAVEASFDDPIIHETGGRRPALVYPADTSLNYDPATKEATIGFSLPAGAYATVVLENLANREFNGE